MPLPNMKIGNQDAERVDWRSANLQDTPDDDAPRPADKDVIEMLGFDPAEMDDGGGGHQKPTEAKRD